MANCTQISATSDAVSYTNFDTHEMWNLLFQLNKKYYVQYDDKYVAFFDISDDTCESFIIFTGERAESYQQPSSSSSSVCNMLSTYIIVGFCTLFVPCLADQAANELVLISTYLTRAYNTFGAPKSGLLKQLIVFECFGLY